MSRVTFTPEQLKKTGLVISEPMLNSHIDFRKLGTGAFKSSVEQKPSNKIGAVKVDMDGLRFASKLEAYAYNLFKILNIDFEFQVTYQLQEAFTYQESKIRPIVIIVDFYIPAMDWIIDTKGYNLYHTKIKLKMLKYRFMQESRLTEIHLPRTASEVDALANKIIGHGLQKESIQRQG